MCDYSHVCLYSHKQPYEDVGDTNTTSYLPGEKMELLRGLSRQGRGSHFSLCVSMYLCLYVCMLCCVNLVLDHANKLPL